VYLGGIPPDASEEDLKEFCESIGEVTEVTHLVFVKMLSLFFVLDGLNLV
jgi:RNA recognition motif-containing protein